METYDALLASITPTAGETRTIFDPATGTAVGEAPVHTIDDLERAVAAAQAAQPAWAALGHEGRSAALLKAADAVERSAEELAHLLSREQGKPLNGPNARFEVGACAAWLRAAATIPL
ncbi:MAG TPA: aldehyde dehydrogenase, partial [Arthrobacter bacterium]|nr:aldehyde dehydrogenase [Arthrobacter sp.]